MQNPLLGKHTPATAQHALAQHKFDFRRCVATMTHAVLQDVGASWLVAYIGHTRKAALLTS